jgi:hypothetical protein
MINEIVEMSIVEWLIFTKNLIVKSIKQKINMKQDSKNV